MRLYLQIQANEKDPVRFCQLLLQQELLGGWTLLRESGRQGGRGAVRRWQFPSRMEAYDALIAERDRLLSRGYRVMFSAGATNEEPRHAH